MSYVALTKIGLPVMEEREVYTDLFAPVATGETVYKEPGEKISKNELKEIGWSESKIEDDLAELAKYKSIGSQEDWDKIVNSRDAEATRLAEAEAEAVLKVREQFAAARAGGTA